MDVSVTVGKFLADGLIGLLLVVYLYNDFVINAEYADLPLFNSAALLYEYDLPIDIYGCHTVAIYEQSKICPPGDGIFRIFLFLKILIVHKLTDTRSCFEIACGDFYC